MVAAASSVTDNSLAVVLVFLMGDRVYWGLSANLELGARLLVSVTIIHKYGWLSFAGFVKSFAVR